MKKFKISKLMLAFTLVMLTVGTLIYTSCTKEDNFAGQQNRKILTASQKQKVLDAINSMPEVKLKVGKNGFTLPKTLKNGGFNFSDSSEGSGFSTSDEFNFAETSDGTSFSVSSNIQFVETSEGNYILVSSDGASANAGGMVVAGQSNLDIGFAFCATSPSEGSFFTTPGDQPDSSNGFSMVIGISGDFDAIANGEANQDDPDAFMKYIYGIAIYVVFEDGAQGSYEVIDFTADALNDIKGKAMSMVFDFRKGLAYISSNGNLTVGSNTISFNGNYFQITYDIMNPDDSSNNDTPSEVSGFGTMGCM